MKLTLDFAEASMLHAALSASVDRGFGGEQVRLIRDRVASLISTHPAPSELQNRRRMSPRQAEVYDFIRAHILQHGYPPTKREICKRFDYRSTTAASDHLKGLERKGYIAIRPKASRGITVLDGEAAE